jgi:hypothetical protein
LAGETCEAPSQIAARQKTPKLIHDEVWQATAAGFDLYPLEKVVETFRKDLEEYL